MPQGRSPGGDRAHGRESADAGYHRLSSTPCRGGPILVRGHSRSSSSLPPFTRTPHSALLCSRPPLLTIVGHRRPSMSPSEPGICSVVTSSSSSTSFKPESMAIASDSSASSIAASSSVSSPSPADVRAPPAPPPLRGGSREPVFHLRPHLLRLRPSVRTIVGHLLPSESTAVASLLR
jgi:hypothetical protein